MPGSRSVLASEKGGRAVGKQTSKKRREKIGGSRKVIRSHRLKSRIAVEKSRQLHNDTNKNYIFKFISKWNYTHGIAFMHNLQ